MGEAGESDGFGSPGPKDFDLQFNEARDWLRQMTHREAVVLLGRELSETTIKRLRGSSYHSFSTAFRWALISAHRPQQRLTLYDNISVLLEQTLSKSDIISQYSGEYRDYRYACPRGNDIIYVSGRIRIYEDPDGNPSFQHWSRSYLLQHGEHVEPQHMGYVMVQNERLFFVGVGDGTLTMSICETFRRKNDPKDSVLHGIVLSTRSSPRDPFSANFILVHSDNKKRQESLDPDNPEGEENFRKASVPISPFYLKIH